MTSSSTSSRSFSSGFDMRAMLKANDISADTQAHLARVYASVGAMMLCSAAGAWVDVLYHVGGLFTILASIGILMYIATGNGTAMQRGVALAAFGFAKGLSLGPLIGHALYVDPSLVVTAVLMTAGIFAAFSVGALFSRRRSMLYMASMLGSLMSMLAMASLANLFFRSEPMFLVQLYGGLVLFAGYIVVDTQMIIERASAGEKDFILHALTLFVDLIAIFARVLAILTRDKKKRDER